MTIINQCSKNLNNTVAQCNMKSFLTSDRHVLFSGSHALTANNRHNTIHIQYIYTVYLHVLINYIAMSIQ